MDRGGVSAHSNAWPVPRKQVSGPARAYHPRQEPRVGGRKNQSFPRVAVNRGRLRPVQRPRTIFHERLGPAT